VGEVIFGDRRRGDEMTNPKHLTMSHPGRALEDSE
jgi:hypothetical protein